MSRTCPTRLPGSFTSPLRSLFTSVYDRMTRVLLVSDQSCSRPPHVYTLRYSACARCRPESLNAVTRSPDASMLNDVRVVDHARVEQADRGQEMLEMKRLLQAQGVEHDRRFVDLAAAYAAEARE